jgi:2-dehydropantoate 2-reductase
MKIAVVGAGAIGGLLAAKLSLAGEDVTTIVRGANLAAIRDSGLKLVMEGEEQIARVRATDAPGEAGPQDAVILGMKAHQLGGFVRGLAPLLGPDTVVVTAQNGIPWWYFMKHGGPHEGKRLESVDPGGVIAEHLEIRRVVGSVIYPASELVAPGVVKHIEGNRISLGELDGAETERVRALADVLRKGGFKARVASDLRSELWVKLWGNCTFNPVSALTHATLEDICRFPATRELAAAMMREAQVIGERLGVRFPVSLEKRIAGAEAVGAHKTSMLQDVEAGRPIELEALLGSVLELGKITATPTPHLSAVHACASLLAKTLADAGGRLAIEKSRA